MPKTIVRDRERKLSREPAAFAPANEGRTDFDARHGKVNTVLPFHSGRTPAIDRVVSSDPKLRDLTLAETAHDLNMLSTPSASNSI